MNQHNILFLVWDSARLDYVQKYAPTLQELAKENVWCESAIAPATWSLPSHASIISGLYPHQHNTNRITDTFAEIPLVEQLRENQYKCYGVSANGFAHPKRGFAEPFHSFRDTRTNDAFSDGFPVHEFTRNLKFEGVPKSGIIAQTFNKILEHEHPYKSLANFISVVTHHLANHNPKLERIPSDWFDAGDPYTPSKNTIKIGKHIKHHQYDDDPFFIFANYMDCHRPYNPSKDLQRKHLDTELEQSELNRLNALINPWKFIEQTVTGDGIGIEDQDIQKIRSLYAGAVEHVDRHLQKILNVLDDTGLREDTLVIIVADHGENLGEVDQMGNQRFGHEASVSDALLRVPCVIAHPELEAQTIKEPMSLKKIYDLCTMKREQLLGNNSTDIGSIICDEKYALGEYPVVGGEDIFNRYANIPESLQAERRSRNAVAVYGENSRIVLQSTGEQWAWIDQKEVPIDEVPDKQLSVGKEALQKLTATDDRKTVSTKEKERLEALGYM